MTDSSDVKNALSDRDTLVLTMLGEARGEEIEGRIAVACVVRNRVKDDRWPDTLKAVCLQPWQFSCWNPSDPNYRSLVEKARFLIADHAIRSTFVPDAIFRETTWIADGILSGVVRDRVSANHYLSRQLWETAPPKWAIGKRPSAFVGRHVFLTL